ncbi:Alpha/Beta hydrolase protein, partial [Polychytrium aggregatum]|uniref:Alpha/Beta hydrolase protein n=1 Tax=Polychytrium aggregatum TaxID=110093 RepID=UPI0022FDFA18
PNMGDPTTIRNLGQMSLNSYFEPSASAMQNKWENVPGFNQTERFGWLDNGIRGYVFSDAKREVVVLAIKGSGSPDTPVPSGPTSEQDKFNDNIMFSCCCAASFWYPICQCHNTKDKTCNRACILGQSNFNSSYYNIAQSIYKSVETWYPRKASIWVTGHSLGGSLASLLALTNDVPAVAFEAPGDMLYAGRIGLLPALPPRSGTTRPDYTQFFKTLPIYHIGNTQDPIFYGECTAWTSVCWRGGISMESKCHVGKECIYNDASKVASSSLDAPPEAQGFDMKYHGMGFVLDHFLKAWDRVPECKPQEDCQECTEWREV